MNGDCNQYSCAAVIRDGKIYVAKFDWARPNTRIRDLKNIRDNYMGWIPNHGEEVYFVLLSLNGKERSDCVLAGKWK